MVKEDLKEQVALACKILYNQGLVEGFGHISARKPHGDRFYINPRMSPALVKYEDVLTINLEGKKIEGKREPNSETAIHTSIYQARKEISSIAHTHSPLAIIMGILGKEIRPLEVFGALFADGIPIFKRPGLITDQELGKEVALALGNHRALLLRGHGAIIVGKDIKETCLLAIYLERTASLQYQALLAGEPHYFSREEALRVKKELDEPPKYERAWEYYRSKAGL